MPVLRGFLAEWRFVYPAVFSSRTTAGNLQEAIAAQAQVRRRHSAHARPILWQRQQRADHSHQILKREPERHYEKQKNSPGKRIQSR